MPADGILSHLPTWIMPGRHRQLESMVGALRDDISRDHKEIVRELRDIRRTAERQRQQIEQALAEHEQTLARLPELQRRVEQCVAAYVHDARCVARIQDFGAGVDRAAVMAHARASVSRATLDMDPCAHVVLEQVFPDDVYDRLVEALPAPIFFDKVSEHRDEMPVPFVFAPAYSRLVWELFHDVINEAVLPALIEAFRPALDAHIRTSWPSLGSWDQAAVNLRLANARLMLRRPGYVITPHRDPRWAFLVALFYVSPRGTPHTYGTQLYRLKVERDEAHTSPMWVAPDDCELVRDVPGIGNTAVVFLNSTGAHGASIPADAPPDFLRHVYQARISPDRASKERLLGLLEGDSRDRWVATR